MKLLLSLAVLVVTLGVLYSAADGEAPAVTEDTLKREATQRNTHLSSEQSLSPAGSSTPFSTLNTDPVSYLSIFPAVFLIF